MRLGGDYVIWPAVSGSEGESRPGCWPGTTAGGQAGGHRCPVLRNGGTWRRVTVDLEVPGEWEHRREANPGVDTAWPTATRRWVNETSECSAQQSRWTLPDNLVSVLGFVAGDQASPLLGCLVSNPGLAMDRQTGNTTTTK